MTIMAKVPDVSSSSFDNANKFEGVVLPSIMQSEYIDHYQIVTQDDIDELMDLQLEMDSFVYLGMQKLVLDYNYVERFSKSLKKYGTVLMFYPLFRDLGDSVRLLGEIVPDSIETIVNKKEFVGTLLETFVSELYTIWKHAFLNISKTPEFYNHSLVSDIQTIIRILDKGTNEPDESSIEFF